MASLHDYSVSVSYYYSLNVVFGRNSMNLSFSSSPKSKKVNMNNTTLIDVTAGTHENRHPPFYALRLAPNRALNLLLLTPGNLPPSCTTTCIQLLLSTLCTLQVNKSGFMNHLLMYSPQKLGTLLSKTSQ